LESVFWIVFSDRERVVELIERKSNCFEYGKGAKPPFSDCDEILRIVVIALRIKKKEGFQGGVPPWHYYFSPVKGDEIFELMCLDI
jgi:hypothetical protein